MHIDRLTGTTTRVLMSARAASRQWRASVVSFVVFCLVSCAGLVSQPASASATIDQAPPAWFNQGRPLPAAQQAVEALTRAQRDGLDPADYGAGALQRSVVLALLEPLDDAASTRIGSALTQAMLRYARDLKHGRIDPREVHSDFAPIERPPFDTTGWLRNAVDTGRLPQAIDALTPRNPLYGRLRQSLADYRALLAGAPEHPAWKARLAPVDGRVGPGDNWPGLDVLVRRLLALGDLPASVPVPGPGFLTERGSNHGPATRYTGAIVDAVKAFQRRHGLQADGIIGKATWAQLQISPTARIRQLELTLERLRWTPLEQGRRMIVINVPEFVLRAYDVGASGFALRAQMKVIVGQSLDKRTPLFDEDMRSIEFSPYWNIPWSIARDETVPRLKRDPGYLAREGLEFVMANGKVDTSVSAAHLAAVLAGQARIRQRPGPKNALGDIKFVFPNADNIYLHHTPSTRLFTRERRDFSHGCIRVENPVELARFVLAEMPDWTVERILEAMENGYPSTVRLTERVPVLIAYATALVIDGELRFFDDIYGQDRELDAALRKVSRQRQEKPDA